MADIWLPGFERVISAKSGGGTYDPGVVHKKIWHKTQGFSKFPRATAKAHANPPHLWVTLPSHPYAPGVLMQIIPLNRSAMALKRPAGSSTSPNKQGAIQTEIEGFSDDGMSDEDAYWLGVHVLGPVCRAMPGIDPNIIWEAVAAGTVPNMASTKSSIRRPQSEYIRFNGQGCHQHVWGNSHYDIGAGNLSIVRDGANDFLGRTSPVITPTPTPAPEGDLTVDQADRIIDFLHRQNMALSGDNYTPDGDKIPDITSLKDVVGDIKLSGLQLAVWTLQKIAADGVNLSDLSEDELADLIVQKAGLVEAEKKNQG